MKFSNVKKCKIKNKFLLLVFLSHFPVYKETEKNPKSSKLSFLRRHAISSAFEINFYYSHVHIGIF